MSKYDFEMQTEAGTIPGMMMERIFPGADVLEFGCASGRMTKYMREEKNCRVSVVELDREAFEKARNYAEDGICCDIEAGLWKEYFAGKSFDFILFADVLEHLREAAKTLREAKDFLRPGGKILVSIPNIAHNDVVASLYNNSFAYRETGLLDNTHIHFWGQKELVRLAEESGLFLELLDGAYQPPFCSELREAGENVPEILKTLLKSREYNDVYQFFMVLSNPEAAEEEGHRTEIRLKKTGSMAAANFYWDLGSGYRAGQFASVPGTDTHGKRAFRAEDIPEGCVKVRFDPPGTDAFFVSDCRAVMDDGEVRLPRPLNGQMLDDGAVLFHNTLAQMEFELPAGAAAFTLYANIEPCLEADAERLEASARARSAENAQHNEEHVRQLRENRELLFENRELLSENRELASSHRALEKKNGELEEAYRTLAGEHQELESLSAAQQKQAEEYREERDALSAALDEAAEKSRELCEENDRLAQNREELRAEKHQLLLNHRELARNYDQLNGLYTEILRSRFWRMTAPFRFVLDKVRGNKPESANPPANNDMVCAAKAKAQNGLQEANQSFSAMLQAMEADGADVLLKDAVLKMEKGCCVLLVSHEFNLTGAPVAIEFMAKSLLSLGRNVIAISPRDGALREHFSAMGVPSIVYEEVYRSDLIKRSTGLFEMIVVNTNVGAPLVQQLSGMDVPVLWWIHEARASYSAAAVEAMPEELGDNIRVYCAGTYAVKMLQEYCPAYAPEILLYSTPDYAQMDRGTGTLDLSEAGDKTVFVLVGMLEHRKGQDILAEAIRQLPAEKRERCYFVFVGRQCYPPQYSTVMNLCGYFPENVRHIEELERYDIRRLYERADCLVCASRDDPMPIVVTEAMTLSKPIICSENTGSADLLEKTSAALVYHNDDPAELARCMENVLENGEALQDMGRRARKTYETYFTETAFNANLAGIVRKITPAPGKFAAIPREYFSAPDKRREVFGEEVLRAYDENGKKNILLLSHELSLSGAPLVLRKMADVFREQGNNVTILSPFDGPLRDVFVESGYPLFVFEDVYDAASNDFLSRYGARYDLIVINTVVTYRAVGLLADLPTPVVWWIHDSHASYTYGGFGSCLPAEIPPNVTILCVGAYAKKQLLQHYPGYRVGELLYAIDDCAENKKGTAPCWDVDKRKLFVIVGTIERRKGQDIAAEAIRWLPMDALESCRFVFVGKEIEPEIMDEVENLCRDMPDRVRYLASVPHDDLIALYREADCLICSSRDDPMPVVVTEMQALSRPVICSENTGSAALIEKYGGGLIYQNDDPRELADQICHILEMPEEALAAMGEEGRRLFETCFSEQTFERELAEMTTEEYAWKQRCANTVVSVVIPTYNAGEAFPELLRRLNAQRGLAGVEIIVVDSGSRDGTPEAALDGGARLIRITQEEFSHSYARNLGAESASGKVLLFMTQDALPSGDTWALEMAMPILTGEVSAVSCREQCPGGTDLYYRAASWNHSRLLGIDRESRIGRPAPGLCGDELRRSASLNDVSTAIDRGIFLQMKYRHSFAEDLDMGIRLLQAGKSIKLLHEPAVIHGHNRPASYYLRRGLAESRSVPRILGLREEYISAAALSEQIVTEYWIIQRTLLRLRREEIVTPDSFRERFEAILAEEKSGRQTEPYAGKGADAYVEDCILKLSLIRTQINGHTFDLTNMVLYYCAHVLLPFLTETEWTGENAVDSMCDCIYKQMSLGIGNLLARMNPEDPGWQTFKKLTDGV